MTDAPPAAYPIDAIRARFSSLRSGWSFFDAPGGSQVPDEVGDAIARAMREAAANLGGGYPTSRRAQQIVDEAHEKGASFLGCDAGEVILGANMTTLNFALSRTAARTYEPGDEIIVSALDHDGGIAPWLELAHDKGLVIKQVELHPDTTYDLDDLQAKLSPRTKVVAFAWASNAVGTIVDAKRVCELAHEHGALAWIDAVHYAAHRRIDVREVGADVLLCSPYKFCGPHLGMAYGRAEVLETWRPYKVRPALDHPVGHRFETGTPSFESLAGLNATFDYLDSIGGYDTIVPYETALGERFVNGLPEHVTMYGLPGMEGRVPTFVINVEGLPAAQLAQRLAEQRIAVWATDNWYAVELYPRLGYAPDEAVRIGIFHYTSEDDVDRLLGALEAARA